MTGTRTVTAPPGSGRSAAVSIGAPIASAPPPRPPDGSILVQGNFQYDFDREGWVLREEIRNRPDMPIIILVGADDFYLDWMNRTVNSVIAGTADAGTLAFFQTNGAAGNPSDGWKNRPEAFRSGGPIIVFDFQYYEKGAGVGPNDSDNEEQRGGHHLEGPHYEVEIEISKFLKWPSEFPRPEKLKILDQVTYGAVPPTHGEGYYGCTTWRPARDLAKLHSVVILQYSNDPFGIGRFHIIKTISTGSIN